MNLREYTNNIFAFKSSVKVQQADRRQLKENNQTLAASRLCTEFYFHKAMYFYLFNQHLFSALFTNRHALMRYLH